MDKQLYILNVTPRIGVPHDGYPKSSRFGPWQRLFTEAEVDLIKLLGVQIGFCANLDTIPVEMPKQEQENGVEAKSSQRMEDALQLMDRLEKNMHGLPGPNNEVSEDTIEYIQSLISYNPKNY